MNGNFKGLIYGAGAILIFILAAKLFFHILPWLLIIGVGVYVFTKVSKSIKAKKADRDNNKFNNNSNYDEQIDEYSPSNSYDNYDVIDVDYEEVDTDKR